MAEDGRGFYAKALAVIANGYLIAFALDGLLSLLDELLVLVSAGAVLNLPRAIVAGVVVLYSILMLLPIIFAPRLPKHVFLPLVAFAIWGGLGAPPFVFDHGYAGLILALAQVALAAFGFFAAHRRGGSWLFNVDALPPRGAPLLRVGIALVVAITVTPILGGGLMLFGFAQMIELQTGGYVDFTSSGINLRETVLEKDGKTVRLVAMMHIGESRYYEEFYRSVPDDALIIEEGVSDREGKLAGQFSYRRLARVLGLEQQPRFRSSAGADADDAVGSDAPAPSSPQGMPQGSELDKARIDTGPGPDVLNPDVDVSEFDETTIAFLLEASNIYQSDSAFEAFQRLISFMAEAKPEQTEKFLDDVVYKRNARVIAALDQNLASYDVIVVPWGALHMPGLQEKIEQRGFKITSSRTIPLARYETIFLRSGA